MVIPQSESNEKKEKHEIHSLVLHTRTIGVCMNVGLGLR